jgi:hypothetical protein
MLGTVSVSAGIEVGALGQVSVGWPLHLFSFPSPRIIQSAPRVRRLSSDRAEAWRVRPAIHPVQTASVTPERAQSPEPAWPATVMRRASGREPSRPKLDH